MSDVRMTGITITYLQHICFFYDEIGSRPPNPANLSAIANATLALDDIKLTIPQTGGFNLTGAADVPAYAYRQSFRFFPDGRFMLLMKIGGGGCFDIHTYQPHWRINFDLGGRHEDTISSYNVNGWLPIRTESQLSDSGLRDPSRNFTVWEVSDGKISYNFAPFESPQPSSTSPKLLVEYSRSGEIENSHSPAKFSPYIYLNGERVYRTHIAVWYIAQHLHNVHRELYFKVPLVSGLIFYPGNS